MPIIFEEVSGEIVPEPRREEEPGATAPGRPSPRELEDRVRAALARAERLSLRLSDR